jgi:hypothetical protein
MPLSFSEQNRRRRARKFEQQGGICHWFVQAQRGGIAQRKSKCPDPDGRMTLELLPDGNPPPHYATYEHLQRRRDGGAGKPNNVVLACLTCNVRRDKGTKKNPKHYCYQPQLPHNVEAKRMTDEELFQGLRDGTLTDAARAQLYSRGLVPNWPMWTKIMAREPLGPF